MYFVTPNYVVKMYVHVHTIYKKNCLDYLAWPWPPLTHSKNVLKLETKSSSEQYYDKADLFGKSRIVPLSFNVCGVADLYILLPVMGSNLQELQILNCVRS